MKVSLGLFYATEKKRILKMGTVFGKVVKDEQLRKDREKL